MKKVSIGLFVFLLNIPVLWGYSSRTDLQVLDINGQNIENFSGAVTPLTVKTNAYYCKEEDKTSGTYSFSLKISDPQGRVLKSYDSGVKSLPSDENKILTYEVKNIDPAIVSLAGFYRFDAVYTESYNGVVSSQVPVTKKLYYSGNGTVSDVFARDQAMLLNPADESIVQTEYPFFFWTTAIGASKYKVFVSEDPDPFKNPVWVSEFNTQTTTQYPLSARKLQKGKKYYWMVQSFDANSIALGGPLNHSNIFSFYLGYGEATGIILLSPMDGSKVSKTDFELKWQNLYGSFDYEVMISETETFEDLLWTSLTRNNSVTYPISAPELIYGKTYYWKVRTAFPGYANQIESKTSSFLYNVETKTNSHVNFEKGESGLSGTIIGPEGEPIPYANIVIIPSKASENNDTRFSDSVQADNKGKFSLKLPQGEYLVEVSKEAYKTKQEKVTVKDGDVYKLKQILYPSGLVFKGKIVNIADGKPVANAPVVLSTALIQRKIFSDSQGVFSFSDIKAGDYHVEVDYSPFFKPFARNVTILNSANADLQVNLIGEAKGNLRVLVNSDSGLPPARGTVKLTLVTLVDTGLPQDGKTGFDGFLIAGSTYISGISAGEYVLSITGNEFPDYEKKIKINQGEEKTIEYVYNSKPLSVKGKTVNQGNNPLTNVLLTFVNQKSGETKASCSSSLNANFDCQVFPGDYILKLNHSSGAYAEKPLNITADKDLGSMMLADKVGTLFVKVTDNQGVPLSGIPFKLKNASQRTYNTNDSGEIKIENTGVGTNLQYIVEARDKGYFTDEGVFLFTENGEQLHIRLPLIVKVYGRVLTQTGDFLRDSRVSITGNSGEVSSIDDGSFAIEFPEPPKGVKEIQVVFKRDGYFTEIKSVNLNQLQNPVVVRLRSEMEKMTSFTLTRIMNTIREVKDELDSFKLWMDDVVQKAESDLLDAKSVYLSYKDKVDIVNNKIKDESFLLSKEMQKGYLTAKAMALYTSIKSSNSDVIDLTNKMENVVGSEISLIERFVTRVKRVVNVSMPSLDTKLLDLKESVEQSPFLGNSQRSEILVIVNELTDFFNMDVKTFYKEKESEIDAKLKELADSLKSDIKETVQLSRKQQQETEVFLAWIENQMESQEKDQNSDESLALSVLAVSPSRESRELYPNEHVVVIFNKTIDKNSLKLSGEIVSGARFQIETTTKQNDTIKFYPGSEWETGSRGLDIVAQDIYGKSSVSESFLFSVQAKADFYIRYSSITSGDKIVNQKDLTVVFSADVDKKSFQIVSTNSPVSNYKWKDNSSNTVVISGLQDLPVSNGLLGFNFSGITATGKEFKSLSLSFSKANTTKPCPPDCISVDNPEELLLVQRIADISSATDLIKRKLSTGVDEVASVPRVLSTMIDKADVLDQNIQNSRSSIRSLDQATRDFLVKYALVKEYLNNIEDNLARVQISNVEMNVIMEKTSDPNIIKASGALLFNSAGWKKNMFASASITFAEREVDLSKVIEEVELLSLREDDTKAVEYLSDELQAIELISDNDQSNVKNIFPKYLTSSSAKIVDALGLASTREILSAVPKEIIDFNSDRLFPESVTKFKLDSLSEADKQRILTVDPYEYVWSALPPVFKMVIPSEKPQTEALKDDFLLQTYLEPKLVSSYNRITSAEKSESEAESIVIETALKQFPEFKKSLDFNDEEFHFEYWKNNEKISLFLSAFLETGSDESSSGEAPAAAAILNPDMFDSGKVSKIFPQSFNSFSMDSFIRNAGQKYKEEFCAEETEIPEFDIPGFYGLKFGYSNATLGCNVDRDRFYLQSDLKLGIDEASAQEVMRDMLGGADQLSFEVEGVKVYDDGKFDRISALAFEGPKNPVKIMGFSAKIDELRYQFPENEGDSPSFSLQGKVEFKVGSQNKKVNISKAEYMLEPDGWILDKFSMDVEGVKLLGVVFSGMEYDRQSNTTRYWGEMRSPDKTGTFGQVTLTEIIMTDGKMMKASGKDLSVPFLHKSVATFKATAFEIEAPVENDDPFKLAFTEPLIQIPYFKTEVSGQPYSIVATDMKVLWKDGQKPEFLFNDLAMEAPSFALANTGFSFGINRIVLSKEPGDIYTWQFTASMSSGMPGFRKGLAEFVWNSKEPKNFKLERAKLEGEVAGFDYSGVLMITDSYLYSHLKLSLAKSILLDGEYFNKISKNPDAPRSWYIAAKTDKAVVKIPVLTVGVASVQLAPTGFKVGERESKFIVGLTGQITADAGASQASQSILYGEGKIGFISGENLLTFDLTGTMAPFDNKKIFGELPSPITIRGEVSFKEGNQYLDVSAGLGLENVYDIMSVFLQADFFASEQYISISARGGGRGAIPDMKHPLADVLAIMGMQSGIMAKQRAPVAPFIGYRGKAYIPPTTLGFGAIIFADLSGNIKIPENPVVEGALYLGGGSIYVVDLIGEQNGSVYLGGGGFSYVNGQAKVLKLVSLSIYAGGDLGAEMYVKAGKVQGYFLGKFTSTYKAKVDPLINVEDSFETEVAIGNPPVGAGEGMPGMNIDDLEPKGKLAVAVVDVYGVPIPGAIVKFKQTGGSYSECSNNPEKVSDQRGVCVSPAMSYNDTTIEVEEPNGLYELGWVSTAGQNTEGQSEHRISFTVPGQKATAIMMPTEMQGGLLLTVNIPDAPDRGAIKGRALLISKDSGERIGPIALQIIEPGVDIAKIKKLFGIDNEFVNNDLVQLINSRSEPSDAVRYAFFDRLAADEAFKVEVGSSSSNFEGMTEEIGKLADVATAFTIKKYKKVSLTLQPQEVELTGIVINDASAVNEAKVEIYRGVEKVKEDITDLSGTFMLAGEGLTVGNYTVKITKENFDPFTQDIELDSSFAPAYSQPKVFNIGKTQTEVRFKLVDIKGKAVSNKALTIHKTGKTAGCTTDPNGECKFNADLGAEYSIYPDVAATNILEMTDITSNPSAYTVHFDNRENKIAFTQSKNAPVQISLVVQTGPVLTGTLKTKAGQRIDVENKQQISVDGILSSDYKVYFGENKESNETSFEIAFDKQTSEIPVKVKVGIPGYMFGNTPQSFDFSLKPSIGQISNRSTAFQNLGTFTLAASGDLIPLLKGKQFASSDTPFTLNVTEDAGRITTAVSVQGIERKIPNSEIFVVDADLSLNGDVDDSYAKGKIKLKGIYVEAALDSKENLKYRLIHESSVPLVESVVDLQAQLYHFSVTQLKDWDIDLNQGTLKANYSGKLDSSKVPFLECSTTPSFTVRSGEGKIGIDSKGNIAALTNGEVIYEISETDRNKCTLSGYPVEFSGDSLYVTSVQNTRYLSLKGQVFLQYKDSIQKDETLQAIENVPSLYMYKLEKNGYSVGTSQMNQNKDFGGRWILAKTNSGLLLRLTSMQLTKNGIDSKFTVILPGPQICATRGETSIVKAKDFTLQVKNIGIKNGVPEIDDNTAIDERTGNLHIVRNTGSTNASFCPSIDWGTLDPTTHSRGSISPFLVVPKSELRLKKDGGKHVLWSDNIILDNEQ